MLSHVPFLSHTTSPPSSFHSPYIHISSFHSPRISLHCMSSLSALHVSLSCPVLSVSFSCSSLSRTSKLFFFHFNVFIFISKILSVTPLLKFILSASFLLSFHLHYILLYLSPSRPRAMSRPHTMYPLSSSLSHHILSLVISSLLFLSSP